MARLMKTIASFGLVGFFLSLQGCTPGGPATDNGRQLDLLIDSYVQFRRNTSQGEWRSAEEWAGRADELRSWECRLEAIPRQGLTLDQDIDYRLVRSDIRTETARIERERAWEKDPGLYLPPEGIDSLLREEQTTPEEKARRLGQALTEIRRRVDLARANLKRPPVLLLDRAVQKAGEAAVFLRSDLGSGIKSALVSPAGLGEELEKAASALDDYARFLNTDLRPQAVEGLGIGQELYDYYLRETYLMNEDTESILEKGETYFTETIRLLEETARKIDPGKTWPDLIRENRRRHPEAGNLLKAWEREIVRARRHVMEKSLAVIPDGESVVVVPTPPALRDQSPFGLMETPRPFSPERVGTLIINPVDPGLPADKKDALLGGHDFTFISTIAPHETYPGHHLHALKVQDNARPMRKLYNSTLFTEGWGLYTEELMFETGYFEDPDRTRLTQLLSRLWRAARVILDVKLQTGRISYEDARRFLEDRVMFEPARSAGEVNMYIGSPTYFITYIIGYFDIMSLRAEVQAKEGSRFSLLGFHEAMLRTGAIPVSLVREILLAESGSAAE